MASREVRNVSKDELKEKCRMVRRAVLRMTDICGSGHYGSAYSMTELVNNAGITQPLKVMEIRQQDYEAVLDVSLRGTLNMTQAVLPQMRGRRSGLLPLPGFGPLGLRYRLRSRRERRLVDPLIQSYSAARLPLRPGSSPRMT